MTETKREREIRNLLEEVAEIIDRLREVDYRIIFLF